jgi:hypothetical protein
MNPNLASRVLASIGLLNVFTQNAPLPAFRGPTRGKSRGKKTRYVQGLQNHFARKQRDRMQAEKTHPLRDEHGAYTRTGAQPCEPWQGQKRRKWLAGISAQRGY